MITFLFGLPRSGSLALSAIMQTEKCDTCHEGLYDDIAASAFVDTEFYKLAMKSQAAGRNFFCCDTGMSIVYAMMMLNDLSKHFGHTPPFKVVCIVRDPVKCAESMLKLQKPGPLMTIENMVHAFREREGDVLDALSIIAHSHIPLALVNKPERDFADHQLEYIANFVGAVDPADMNDREAIQHIIRQSKRYYSYTAEQVQAEQEKYQVAFLKGQLKVKNLENGIGKN